MTNQSYSKQPGAPAIEGPTATGYLAIILAWAVPGLRHFLVGEECAGCSLPS